MAWQSRRFPRRDSRQAFRCPEDTSIGAVPLQAAKWSRFLKREASRTSPMMVAAMTGPTPEQPGQAGPAGPHGGVELLPGLAELGVDAAQVLDQGRGELPAGGRDRVRRRDRAEQAGGVRCDDLLRSTAGDQLAQHRVQADDLGAAAGQVTPPLGPDLEHRRVVIGPGFADAGRAQRGDSHRPGVVGSFLFTFPVASSRTRAPSLGCTSRTRSPADSSCQSSRRPSPPAPSTAQVRSGQAAAHASSRSACAALARTRSCPSGSSAPLITTAVCEALCGPVPIITPAMNGSSSPMR